MSRRGQKLLSIAGVLAIHKDLLRRYRVPSNEVDMAKLELAIVRGKSMVRDPHWKRQARRASQYAWRILEGRPFAEGNSPMALAVLVTFLEMNGSPWHSSEVEETVMVLEAAAGGITEAEWEAWVLSKVGKQQRGFRG
jgi:prophage maintenance system killer protein